MALLNRLATDPSREKEGVWVDYPGTDLQLKIARVGNPGWEQHFKELMRPYRDKRRREGLTETEVKSILAPAVARHILVAWRNLQEMGPENQPIDVPYTEKKALEILRNPALKDLYDFVFEVANDGHEFKVQLDEEATGN